MNGRQKSSAFLLALVCLLTVGSILMADSAGLFSLTWWTVDGGGGASSAGSYRLSGSIGQPDAGESNGGAYNLSGGFWGAALSVNGNTGNQIFLPVILKPS